jgi:spermidine synthase
MRTRYVFEIFVVCLATILLEVGYTRIFSYKLLYFFTYVVIGLALLGIGTGGVVVSLVRPGRRFGNDRVLSWLCPAAAVTVTLAYLAIATVQVNAFDMVRHGLSTPTVFFSEAAKLLFIGGSLFVSFLCTGIIVASLFASDLEHIGTLYFADLVGAGVGCAISVPLITALTPPGMVMLAGAAFAVAGLRVARTAAPRAVLPVAALAVFLVTIAVAGTGQLPEIVVDATKSMNRENRPPVLFSRWDPVFRVDVLDSPLFAHVGYALVHDGMWGSIVPRVEGDLGAFSRYDTDARALPFAVIPPAPTVTIIGAAGGSEILTALHLGARRVTGVELNPVTVSLLTTEYKQFTGAFADDPRVHLVNAEGRAFLAATPDRSDLIWFVAPDSYAAMNAAMSGAFVLSESYLYTTEAIDRAFQRLSPGGVVCAQFGEVRYEQKPNRTTRYLTTARAALARMGIHDFANHVLVATSPGFAFTTSTILLRREPFVAEDASRLQTAAKATGSRVRWSNGVGDPGHPVTAAIALDDDAMTTWYATYPFDVHPVTDDRPFFWHFIPFRSAFRTELVPGAQATEEGLGERLLFVLLALVTVLAAVALALPILVRRNVWRGIPHKATAAVYFAAIGLGFMFCEITLIQRLTLLLGYPTHSLSVTLAALLVSAGMGSLAVGRTVRSSTEVARLVGTGLAIVGVASFVLLPRLESMAGGASFPARVTVALVAILPLGCFLGTFLPLGLRTMSRGDAHSQPDFVAWAWAVNGFFSVIASVLGTLLSMTLGFQVVLATALTLYAVAMGALLRLDRIATSSTTHA